MELTELRKQIDAVDAQLTELLTQRMDIAAQIALWKHENGRPALDARREQEKLETICENAREDMREPLRTFYALLFQLSRTRQNELLLPQPELLTDIRRAIGETPPLFPESAHIACPGAEGSNAAAACERLFVRPQLNCFRTFEGVFSAVSSGLCDYGVLPIENSSAGSVKQVYDLLIRSRCFIVRSTRLNIRHALLAKPGVSLSDIRTVYSHEQALAQCADRLAAMPEVLACPCSNTAEAARLAAETERGDVAALADRRCAELYGLAILSEDFQDTDNNYTRFICIARQPEIYPGASRTTLMLTVPHRPGALYQVLARLYCLGLNVLRLESRPIPNRDFEFMFYFDIESSIYSPKFDRMIRELSNCCEELHYLGSYSEVV